MALINLIILAMFVVSRQTEQHNSKKLRENLCLSEVTVIYNCNH